jgi:hypothetical protein
MDKLSLRYVYKEATFTLSSLSFYPPPIIIIIPSTFPDNTMILGTKASSASANKANTSTMKMPVLGALAMAFAWAVIGGSVG